MKQTSADIQPKFDDDTKICHLISIRYFDFLYCYSKYVYVYRISCALGKDVFDYVVFAFTGASI